NPRCGVRLHTDKSSIVTPSAIRLNPGGMRPHSLKKHPGIVTFRFLLTAQVSIDSVKVAIMSDFLIFGL
ncbi:MAG TPA: hypothetical protein VID27_05950, partial [Blastocatellia bacterium]